ncbi:MAG: hypothetical protein WA666_12540 [Nitrospirota bacterium]
MTAKTAIVKRCGLVGAGAGIALFAVFGLLQGAMLGGTAGVAVANHIFGANTFEVMAGDVLPRIIVAACMVAGVGVAFAILVSAGTMIGVVAGYLLALTQQKEEANETRLAPEANKSR